MARINVYEELPTDSRFIQLCDCIGRQGAYGALMMLWERGQEYWRKGRLHIPKEHFERLPNGMDLVRCGFVKVTEHGAYCSGAEDRWGFLLQRSDAGKASAKARLEKYGSTIPVNAKNSPNGTERAPNGTEPSPSPSFKKRLPADVPSDGTRVWEAYKKSWELRYQTELPRSAKTNSICKKLASLLGAGKAIEVGGWYPSSFRDPFHVRARHPLELLLKDATGVLVDFTTAQRNGESASPAAAYVPIRSDDEIKQEIRERHLRILADMPDPVTA